MNGFVTDVDYFRKNRNIIKFSTFLIFALIVPSVVYSQPDNEIELPTSNLDFENGILTKYQVHNGLYQDNFAGNFKHYPIRKGKHHKKSSKIRSRKFLDPNKQYFDYYPVEKVDLKENSNEDDNIEVVLLSEQEKSKKNLTTLLENKIHKDNYVKKRSKRDLTAENNNNNNNDKSKRQVGYDYQPPVNPTYDREYYSQAPQHSWFNQFNSRLLDILSKPQVKLVKYSIPGNYYNAISPSGYYLPVDTTNGNNGQNFGIGTRGEFDERLVWSRIPVRGTTDVNQDRVNCNCPDRNTGNQNQNSKPSNSGNNNQLPPLIHEEMPPSTTTPPLIHVARPPGSRSPNRNTPLDFTTRFDSDSNIRDRVLWGYNPPRVENDEQEGPVAHSSPPLVHVAQGPGRNRIDDNNGFGGIESEIQNQEPAKCVWAIVSCCERNNLKVRYKCFEEIGCHGAFWGINPCADEYQRKAIAVADSYFD